MTFRIFQKIVVQDYVFEFHQMFHITNQFYQQLIRFDLLTNRLFLLAVALGIWIDIALVFLRLYNDIPFLLLFICIIFLFFLSFLYFSFYFFFFFITYNTY